MTVFRSPFRFLAVSAIASGGMLAATPAQALVINPIFGTTGGAPAFTQAQKDTINSVIAQYQTTFTDNMTVNIKFNNMNSGLGQSQTQFGLVDYASFHSALMADALSANDTAAMAKLASTPYTQQDIYASEANFKALGFDTSAFGNSADSVIGLNAGLCFTGHSSPISGKYDLYAVTCHELDEALGTVSNAGDTTALAADLYRFDANGNRTLSTSTGIHVFFSIDGTSHIVEYNQFGRTGGDWGDWRVNNPAQVQDWQGTSGQIISPGESEFSLLDVVGYDRAPVPEPASMVVLSAGVLALIRKRKSK